MTISCSQCGSSFPDDFNFCLTCGKRLNGGSVAPPPSEAGASRLRDDGDRRERSAPAQEEIPAPSRREDDPNEITQEISEGEYLALVEPLQALREQVRWLARPLDFDPRRFFAVFDRVKPRRGYVPDFIFTPSSLNQPGGGPMSWSMEGRFNLYTRLVLAPRLYRRVAKPAPTTHGQPELKHLAFERSASGFLQFAVLCQEAELWRKSTVSWWTYASDWRWVCSRQRLEALVPELRDASALTPTYRMFGRSLTEEHRQWLSTVDAGLRVRMRGEKAEVGGLAYSHWDGFAWLDCELTWPNRFRISRLEELRIHGVSRTGAGMPVY